MRTELFTVSRIFTETLYRIPDYQRGYSWTEDHLKDFWLDLEQLEPNAKHYTGVLTLEAVPPKKWASWEDDQWIIKSRRYSPYYVVDGQQRLTTVVILLQAILESVPPLDVLNFTPVSDIRKKYIFDSKVEDSSRSYLFGYEKDNPSYEYLKTRIFLEESDVHLPEEETIYTKNLLAAKNFFSEQLKTSSKSALETLFTKVTQQLVFNVYEIASDIDVFVTFETMNNRGKALSTLELLKNRLIFLSTKIPATAKDHNPAKLRRAINDAWKTTYHFLGKNDSRQLDDDVFLRTHLSLYYPTKLSRVTDNPEEDPERSYQTFLISCEEFNRFLLHDLFTPKRLRKSEEDESTKLPELTHNFIYEYSQNLKSSIDTYYKLSTPADSAFSDSEKVFLERIGRLRGYHPNALLLAIYRMESSSQKRLKFLEKFERHLFCTSIGSPTSVFANHRRNMTPPHVVSYINKKTSIEELTQQYENFTTELFKEKPAVDLLHDWVKDGPGYYGWRSIKYFLYEYELSLAAKAKTSREKLDWQEFSRENYRSDYETIEHIYPQRPRAQYWIDRFPTSNTQRRLLRNSLGNLLPLCRPKNASLSNKSFPEKLGDHEKKTGYRYGCYCENEVANLAEWGPQQILERGISLLEFLEKRWQVNIGDRSAKIKALGLGFLVAR